MRVKLKGGRVFNFNMVLIIIYFLFIQACFGVTHINKRIKIPIDKTLAPIINDECPDGCLCSSRQGEVGQNVSCVREKHNKVPIGISEEAKFLDLSANLLTELNENSFSGVMNLKFLNLNSNNISSIHVRSFANIIHLEILLLRYNRITSAGLIDFVFSSLTSLKELDLGGCKIEQVNVHAFLNLTELRKIDLSGNFISNFPIFTHQGVPILPNLRYLNLENNRLKSIPFSYVSSLSNLIQMTVEGNQVSEVCVDENLLSNETITPSVQCSDDVIFNETNTGLSTKDDIMKYVTQREERRSISFTNQLNCSGGSSSSIQHLSLSKNHIKSLSANCFSSVSSLVTLVLAQNRIVHIHAAAFFNLLNLKNLVLAGNPIAAFEDFVFSHTTSLEQCDLTNINMTTINEKAFYNSKKLELLLLDGNNLTIIPQFRTVNISYFKNYRKKLSITRNKVYSLNDKYFLNGDPRAFSDITILTLDYNLIAILNGSNFLRFTWLNILSLKYNKISAIYSDTFQGLVYLRSLDLSYNSIKTIHDGAFSPLCSLIVLALTNAGLERINVKSFVNLTSLRDLRLDNNTLSSIPNFIHHKNISILPNLTDLSITSNNFKITKSYLNGLQTFPKLQMLTLNKNLVFISNYFLEPMISLKKLELIKCRISVDKFGLKSSSLNHLILDESYMSMNRQSSFEEAHSLKVLHMPKCQQDERAPKRQTLRNLAVLETIDLSYTGIIPNSSTFTNSSGIRYLNLNGNPLRQLDQNIFKDMIRLRSLHLSNTDLTVVNYTSLPEDVWEQLVEIDLSKNHFVCNCSVVWFRNFLRTTKINIVNKAAYTCEFPVESRGKEIQTLKEPSDLECFTPPIDWYITSIAVVLAVFALSSAMLSLLYRFRWHVRYWQSVLTTREQQYIELTDSREYMYDAFVMYCQQDSQWVIHELQPHLEVEANLRLCIHHRDWLGGRDITDNIMESIESSRKCLLIVSNAFAASQWCHFELTMAQSRLYQDDRDNIVLVVLEEIDELNVTPRLRLQMQRQTYIEWTVSDIGRQLFWARLGRALRKPDQSVINSPLDQGLFVNNKPN